MNTMQVIVELTDSDLVARGNKLEQVPEPVVTVADDLSDLAYYPEDDSDDSYDGAWSAYQGDDDYYDPNDANDDEYCGDPGCSICGNSDYDRYDDL